MKGQKKPSLNFKIALDLILFCLFVKALAFRLSSEKKHEWLGLLFVLLLGLHLWANWAWFRNLFKGNYNFKRAFAAIINCALIVLTLVMAFGGIMNSTHVFGFWDLNGTFFHRQLHTVAAYWMVLLVGIHIGLNWAVLGGRVRKLMGGKPPGLLNWAPSLLIGALAVLGLWASFDRAMGAKLFSGLSFDFWPDDRANFMYYLSFVGIMIFYGLLAHYLTLLPKFFSKKYLATRKIISEKF